MVVAHWRTLPDASALALAAAEHVVAAIEAGGERPGICLTGGSTPRRLYQLLGADPWARRIPWKRAHWFVGDERFVPASHRLSNIGQARQLFLDRHAPASNVHAVRTDALDVHAAADAYQADVEAFRGNGFVGPTFAIVLLGVGVDGHVASIFPGSSAALESRRSVLGIEQAGLAPFVPRVTLTVPALSSGRELLFLATRREKAPVLAQIAAGANVPATRVTSAIRTTWLVDAAAAPPPEALAARLLLVMGVSGAGKTTIGSELARRLGWQFLDADDLHASESKAKMAGGEPLGDMDRLPWLRAVRTKIANARDRGVDLIIACSALKRTYRDVLLSANARYRIIYLRGSRHLIAKRLAGRKDHFMSPALLEDQLNVMEEPRSGVETLVVDVKEPLEAQVSRILAAFHGFINAGRKCSGNVVNGD